MITSEHLLVNYFATKISLWGSILYIFIDLVFILQSFCRYALIRSTSTAAAVPAAKETDGGTSGGQHLVTPSGWSPPTGKLI